MNQSSRQTIKSHCRTIYGIIYWADVLAIMPTRGPYLFICRVSTLMQNKRNANLPSLFFTHFCHRKEIIYRKRGKAEVLGYWYSFFNFCITKLILAPNETEYESLLINIKQNLSFKRVFEQNKKNKKKCWLKFYIYACKIDQPHSYYWYEKKRKFDSLWKIVKDFFLLSK